MTVPFHSGKTLDDVMRWVFERILVEGQQICPTKGPARELSGVLLEVTNPLARISRTETRGRPFSCLGELLWYLAKTNDSEFISYYITQYDSYAEDGEIFGGYGPRLFNRNGVDQIANVTNLLRCKPDSRRAVVQIFEADDLVYPHQDIPCTCTLQFMLRRGQLHMLTYMRSNDAFIGMPHDIFCFTMLQELVARTLSVSLGSYKHMVGSLHLYDDKISEARQFLDEGWQPTDRMMPPMPDGDPKPAIDAVLMAEHSIRIRQPLDPHFIDGLDPYWADLVRLLLVFRAYKDKDVAKISELRGCMSSTVYHSFIDVRIEKLSSTNRIGHR